MYNFSLFQMIWRIVLLAACVQVTWSAYSSPIDTWSDPFWILQHNNVPRQLYLSDALRQRLLQLHKTSAKGKLAKGVQRLSHPGIVYQAFP